MRPINTISVLLGFLISCCCAVTLQIFLNQEDYHDIINSAKNFHYGFTLIWRLDIVTVFLLCFMGLAIKQHLVISELERHIADDSRELRVRHNLLLDYQDANVQLFLALQDARQTINHLRSAG